MFGIIEFKINLPQIHGFFIPMYPINLNFHQR